MTTLTILGVCLPRKYYTYRALYQAVKPREAYEVGDTLTGVLSKLDHDEEGASHEGEVPHKEETPHKGEESLILGHILYTDVGNRALQVEEDTWRKVYRQVEAVLQEGMIDHQSSLGLYQITIK